MAPPIINAKLIAGVRNNSPYAAWAQQGLSPGEIKGRILSTLAPLYRNPSVLDQIPFEVLAKEAVTIGAVRSVAGSASIFDTILSHYRSSLDRYPDAAMSALHQWDPAIARGGSEFISIFLTEADKAKLPLEEARLDLLRNIGGLLEACVQPQLKSLLHHALIARGESVNAKHLDGMRFGNVVDRLWHTIDCQDLLAPLPWRLRLHTWRNIAQHHSAVVDGERIVCDYREGNAIRQIALDRHEMMEVARQLQTILGVLRSARFIFVTDSAELIRMHAPAGLRRSASRPELEFIEFASLLATQGFSIAGIECSQACSHLSVRDETDQPPRERAVHASQFVVATWQYFPCPAIRVTYLDKKGRAFLDATASGRDCEDIVEERIPFEQLAHRVILSLRTNTDPDLGTTPLDGAKPDAR